MNARLSYLFTRRSVRRYTGDSVTDPEIRDLLEAAMAAPSACAKDPWAFVVARGSATLNRLADGLPNGQMLRQADAAIVVCGDPARAHRNELSFLLQDCSAAIENILLAASSLGLGACWLGIHPNEERMAHIRALLGIPAAILPVGVVALGRPAEHFEPRTRFRADAVHPGKW
jgi:nitroreductase